MHGLRYGWACVSGRLRFGLFHIGGIAAGGAIHNGIFTRSGNDLKFFTQIATNCAAVSSYSAVVQTKTIENAAVSLRHVLVAELGAGSVFVKAVGVFHDELAPAHQTKTGAALVAEFGLNLVKVFGQLLIAAQILPRNVSNHFFAGRLNYKLVIVAVLNAQQLGAHFLEAPCFLPQLGRLHDGHGAFNRACAVHLLAHNGLNLANHAQAHRHIGINTCAQTLDKTSAHHQLVANDFGIGRRIAQGGEVELRSFHGRVWVKMKKSCAALCAGNNRNVAIFSLISARCRA